MARLTDLRRNDVDVDREQTALLDSVHDGRDHRGPVTPRHCGHGVLHHVGALLVGLLELQGVQRRLVVIAGPDVMHAAFTADQQLVDVRCGLAHMCIGGPRVAFLVTAKPHATAPRPADVAGRKRDVHQRPVGAVVVVAPDQPLLVGEHRAPTRAARLRLRNPLCRFPDLVGRQPGDAGRLLDAGLVSRQGLVEVSGRCGDECSSTQPLSAI